MKETLCCKCRRPVREPIKSMTDFKKKFKVGDKVTAWSTGKEALIVAIGEERILYKDFSKRERVATYRLPWRKI